MSANNYLKILHVANKWKVIMQDADTDHIIQTEEAKTLKGAIKIANDLVDETEYGIRRVEL